MIIEIMVTCQDSSLRGILSIVRRILLLIQIIVPILLIIWASISFIRLTKNPEEKNGLKRIVNQFLAAAIVFFVPLFVNALMGMLGENTNFSSCWLDANDKIDSSTQYILIDDKEKKSILQDANHYDVGGSNIAGVASLAVRVAPTATPEKPLHTLKNYDNGGAWSKIDDSRLNNFFKIMDATIGKYPNHDNSNPSRKGGINNNNAYASCAQAAAGVIRAIADPDLETGSPDTMAEYLEQNSEKWNLVVRMKAGQRYDEFCQPGDLLMVHHGSSAAYAHVMLYVGNEAVREKFPSSRGNMFEASYHSNQYPTISYHDMAGSVVDVWRPTGKGNFHYPFINVEEVLAN